MTRVFTIIIVLMGLAINIKTSAQAWQEIMQMEASDRGPQDYYGSSVDIDGDYAIVGAEWDNPTDSVRAGFGAGSAYILYNNNGTWEEYQKIWADDGTGSDYFGCSVAISGDYAIIGAKEDEEDTAGLNPLFNAGSAYIFYNNDGVWEQEIKLVPDDRSSMQYFGQKVSISGNDVIIYGGKKIYVFSNLSGTWQQTQKITNDYISNGVSSIASNDSILVIGHDFYKFNQGGACSVYKNISGTWTFQQELIPADLTNIKNFGYSVDISGDFIIAGAPYNIYQPDYNGYAYIFQNIEGTWTEKQKFTASDVIPDDYFGKKVAIEGNYAIVGVQDEDHDALGSDSLAGAGSAYLFYNENGTWIEKNKMLPSERIAGGSFGKSISIDGKYAIIGGSGYNTNQGSTFIYEKLDFPEISKQPENIENICIGEDAIFAISGNYIDTIQWQVSVDTGKTYTDIIDDATYSNSDTDTLNITNINADMTTYLYRCVITNEYGSDMSNAASINPDNESPVITSTHKDTVIIENGNCEVILPDFTGAVTATDNCDASLTLTQEPAAGTLISGMTNLVTLTVKDDYNNIADTTFNVAVGDTIKPVILSTFNDTIISRSTLCIVQLPDFTEGLIATDNCDTILEITQDPPPGKAIYDETRTVTITVTDNFDNESSISFNISDKDTDPPYFWSTHKDTVLADDGSGEATLPDFTVDVEPYDHCTSISNIIVEQNPPAGTVVSGPVNAVSIVLTDEANNKDSVTFNVAVGAAAAFVVTSTHPDTVVSKDINCAAYLPNFTGDVAVTGGSNVVITQDPIAGTAISGATNQVSIMVTDDGEEEVTIIFNAAVEDKMAPVITSTHADVTIVADDACEAVLPSFTGDLTYTENCEGFLVLGQQPVAGTVITGGTNLVTISLSDVSGNTSTVSFNVAVVDTSIAEISCVNNQTVTAGENDVYVVSGTEFDPTVTNNSCGTASLQNNFNNSSTLSGAGLPVGTTTITWTINPGDNERTCSFDVTVNKAVTDITSIQQNRISIYPNPTKETIHIKSDNSDILNLRILDISGKVVVEKNYLDNNDTLDLTGLKNGIYFIRIQTTDEVYTAKIVKE